MLVPAIVPIAAAAASVVARSIAAEVVPFTAEFIPVASTVEIVVTVAHCLRLDLEFVCDRSNGRISRFCREEKTKQ